MFLGKALSTLPILPCRGPCPLLVDPFVTNEAAVEGQMRKLDSLDTPLGYLFIQNQVLGHLPFFPIYRLTPGEREIGLETSLVLAGLIISQL